MKAVDEYLQAWNTHDQAERRRAVEAAFASEAPYADPQSLVVGHDAIVDKMGAAQAQIAQAYPSFRFERTSAIDEHHGRVRFNWALRGGDGTTAIAGVTFGVVAPDGRFGGVAGFFGETPTTE